ncbi:MAG: FliO/MopB family protein [Hyphomicrobiales bacterium]|nr:FliO/MopB family protein [Hyphomicrobiales bacterium]
MLDSIFGEGHTVFKVVFFLIVVLALIAVGAWVFRRFGGAQLGSAAGRGRQPRLGLIEFLNVDGRRRLVLIRRDNVEHLLIIGGPTDVVVEQSIVRAASAARDAPAGRPAGEAVPRPIQPNEGAMWPLQPEPAMPRPESMRPEPVRAEPPRPELPRLEPRPPRPAPITEEQAEWAPEAEPPAPPPPPPPPSLRERVRARTADPLAGLADELGRAPPLPAEPEPRPLEVALQPPPEPPVRPVELPPRQPPRRVPRQAAPPPVAPAAPASPPAAAAPAAPDTEFSAAADQNLAEMAQRLEAALRRPAAKAEERPAAPSLPAGRSVPTADDSGEPPPPVRVAPPRPMRVETARAPRLDAKPAAPQKSLYDSLEQEMASLLGRPNDKT